MTYADRLAADLDRLATSLETEQGPCTGPSCAGCTAGRIRSMLERYRATPPAPPAVMHAAELVAERAKVRAGQYGPEHDADHGYAHLAGMAAERLHLMLRPDLDQRLDKNRRAWVEVGQFVLAALELIDADQAES